MDLPPVVPGKGHEGEHVLFGVAHRSGEFREPLAQGVRDLAPLVDGGLVVFLDEGGAHRGGDHEALSLGDMGQGVPHEVDPAALPGSAEHLGGGRLEALVGIRDDQLDAAQAPPRQGTQEVGPEGLGLRRPDGQSRTSRRPSLFTATATIAATETMRPPCLVLM